MGILSSSIFVILITGLLSYALTRIWLQYSHTQKVLDIPNERSAHKFPTPTSGGVGIVASVTLAALVVWGAVVEPVSSPALMIYISVAATVAVIGFIDDQKNLHVGLRFGLEAAVFVLIILVADPHLNLDLLAIDEFELRTRYTLPLLLLWLIGFTNMYNFMDGIDGIAGTQAVIASLGWIILLVIWGINAATLPLILLAGLICAASIGFLMMNWPPAQIFMGDTGSLFLGFTLAAFPLLVESQISDPRLLIAGALFVFPFLFDATLTIIIRALDGENIFHAHSRHLYQRLTRSLHSHQQVTLLYGFLAILSSITALCYFFGSTGLAVIAFMILLLAHLMLFAYTRAVAFKRA